MPDPIDQQLALLATYLKAAGDTLAQVLDLNKQLPDDESGFISQIGFETSLVLGSSPKYIEELSDVVAAVIQMRQNPSQMPPDINYEVRHLKHGTLQVS